MTVPERIKKEIDANSSRKENKYLYPTDLDDDIEQIVTHVREKPKTGRNEPCTCGSGRKYKKCCIDK